MKLDDFYYRNSPVSGTTTGTMIIFYPSQKCVDTTPCVGNVLIQGKLCSVGLVSSYCVSAGPDDYCFLCSNGTVSSSTVHHCSTTPDPEE